MELSSPLQGTTDTLPGEPLIVVRAGNYTLHGRPLNLGLPLRSVSAVGTAAGSSLGRALVLARLFDPAAVPPRRGTHLRLAGQVPVDFIVDAALGVERPETWLTPRYLAPLSGAAFTGVIPRREAWIVVIDPLAATEQLTARLSA